jgi:hypothetical protein
MYFGNLEDGIDVIVILQRPGFLPPQDAGQGDKEARFVELRVKYAVGPGKKAAPRLVDLLRFTPAVQAVTQNLECRPFLIELVTDDHATQNQSLAQMSLCIGLDLIEISIRVDVEQSIPGKDMGGAAAKQ